MKVVIDTNVLITGNIKHFSKEKFIVTPKEFLKDIAVDAI